MLVLVCYHVGGALYSVSAADLFGDGWGSAKLLLYSSYNGQTSFSPNCLHNPVTTEYCFDRGSVNGDYLIIKVVGLEPSNSWEVSTCGTVREVDRSMDDYAMMLLVLVVPCIIYSD